MINAVKIVARLVSRIAETFSQLGRAEREINIASLAFSLFQTKQKQNMRQAKHAEMLQRIRRPVTRGAGKRGGKRTKGRSRRIVREFAQLSLFLHSRIVIPRPRIIIDERKKCASRCAVCNREYIFRGEINRSWPRSREPLQFSFSTRSMGRHER